MSLSDIVQNRATCFDNNNNSSPLKHSHNHIQSYSISLACHAHPHGSSWTKVIDCTKIGNTVLEFLHHAGLNRSEWEIDREYFQEESVAWTHHHPMTWELPEHVENSPSLFVTCYTSGCNYEAFVLSSVHPVKSLFCSITDFHLVYTFFNWKNITFWWTLSPKQGNLTDLNWHQNKCLCSSILDPLWSSEVGFLTWKVGRTSRIPTSKSKMATPGINSCESSRIHCLLACLSYLCLIESDIHTILSNFNLWKCCCGVCMHKVPQVIKCYC